MRLRPVVLNLHRGTRRPTVLDEQRLPGAIGPDHVARVDVFAAQIVVRPVADVHDFGGKTGGQYPLIRDVPRLQLPIVMRLRQDLAEALRQERTGCGQNAALGNRNDRGSRYACRQRAGRREAVGALNEL